MNRSVIATCTLLVMLVPASLGGPENGAQARYYSVGPDPWDQNLRFKAGERASVFAKGELTRDGNLASGSLLIEVYDGMGNLVVSGHDTLGYAVVFWYPPRSADYKILVHNSSGQEKRLYICIK